MHGGALSGGNSGGPERASGRIRCAGPDAPLAAAVARPLRVEFEGAWYHAMNRGAGHRRIFLSAGDSRKFLEILADVTEIYRLEVHAYCLMDNHYHLLLHTPEAGLGRAMRHLNGVYTQHFNWRNGRDGPLFRGRYRAVLVDSDEFLLQVSRYIHLNPVEGGLAPRPEAYKHSSYLAYLEPTVSPEWLTTSTVLGRLGRGDTRSRYRRFVERGVDAPTRAFYQKARTDPVLGGKSFRSRLQRLVETRPSHRDPEVPQARTVRKRPTLPAITAAVATIFGLERTFLGEPGDGRRSSTTLARGMALYLGRHDARLPLSAAAEWAGFRTYHSAATALTRFRKRLDDTELCDKLRRVRSVLY